MNENDKNTLIKRAINHYEYGIKCDIFSEPVMTYAKLAVEALKAELRKRDKNA